MKNENDQWNRPPDHLGDTLRNVLRLHTERYVGTIAVPIDTMQYKIPAFTVDSIIQHLAPDTVKVSI